ncbi:hypothetical protein AB0D10_42275, partial [Kitasatospora sp. NPDC048545]
EGEEPENVRDPPSCHHRRRRLPGAADRGGGGFAPDRRGDDAPAVIDSFRVVTLGLALRGFTQPDHPDLDAEWHERLADWLRTGRLTVPRTRVTSIDRAPGALTRLFTGDTFGTTIVEP